MNTTETSIRSHGHTPAKYTHAIVYPKDKGKKMASRRLLLSNYVRFHPVYAIVENLPSELICQLQDLGNDVIPLDGNSVVEHDPELIELLRALYTIMNTKMGWNPTEEGDKPYTKADLLVIKRIKEVLK